LATSHAELAEFSTDKLVAWLQREGICSMNDSNDFTTLIAQFSQWLRAHNLDAKEYSLAIFAHDQRALAALQGELNASFQREYWRPAWEHSGVEVHGITIETKLRESVETKPRERDFSVSNLPAAIFWPLAIAQVAFFGWLVFTSLGWWQP
jgi:hypothetical protein